MPTRTASEPAVFLAQLCLLVALPCASAQSRAVQTQQAPQSAERPRIYPYVFDAVDVLWGHLLDGRFQEPASVWFESQAGELYVSDSKSGLIGIFDTEGTPRFTFGRPPHLFEPRQVVASADGAIYVLEGVDATLRAFTYRGEPRGAISFEYPAFGDVEGGTVVLSSFTLDGQGRWYVVDREIQAVLAFEADLTFRFAIRTERAGANFDTIASVAVSTEGLIAVTDLVSTAVQVFDAQGKFLAGFGKHDIGIENFSAPVACAFDDEGYLFVVDMLRHEVKIFEPSGAFHGFFGGWIGPTTRGRSAGELRYPSGIAFGPDGRVFVAERFGQRVQIYRRRARTEQPLDQQGERPR
jgi:DNA-binding beta-propeller fold protein YncE